MSSTKRGGQRIENDYYTTPIEEIEKFLVELNKIISLEGKIILDPSAGGDANTPMSYPKALEKYNFGFNIYTIDIREDSPARGHFDYLINPIGISPDIIITNPPFAISLEFIIKALKDVKQDGYVVMLNRLNFFGSKRRKGFWDNFMPLYTFVHSKRMSFTPDKKTDSIEHCHMVWQKGNYPEFTQLKVI